MGDACVEFWAGMMKMEEIRIVKMVAPAASECHNKVK